MDQILAIIFAILCVWLLYRMNRSRDVVDFQMGVIGAFSLGYYCLPVWFKDLSPLGRLDEGNIATVVGIFILFGFFVVFGTWGGRLIVPHSIAFKTVTLDRLIVTKRNFLTAAAFIFYVYYAATQTLTSYTAVSFEEFFNNRSFIFTILATLSDVALGWIALSFALSWRDSRKVEAVFSGVALGICTFQLLFVGQRLALLSPIVMLMAALALTGQVKRASRVLILGVLVLLIVSPVAVFVRQSLADRTVQSSREAVGSFSYGDDAGEAIFQSIIDRGDLIYVAVLMKPRFDVDQLPGFIYYASVLLNPIPGFIFPGGFKPVPLSTTGLPSGEISIYSWLALKGNSTGSLSAFGGIVAYRELGWGGVIVNGFLTGVLFVFFARWLGQGGFLAKVYYTNLFVSISVMKVPPSFFEALLAVMPTLPFLLAIYLVEVLLLRYRRQ